MVRRRIGGIDTAFYIYHFLVLCRGVSNLSFGTGTGIKVSALRLMKSSFFPMLLNLSVRRIVRRLPHGSRGGIGSSQHPTRVFTKISHGCRTALSPPLPTLQSVPFKATDSSALGLVVNLRVVVKLPMSTTRPFPV